MNDPAVSNASFRAARASIDFNTPALRRHRRLRALVDRLTRWYVLIGGLAVLAAITLIFFYLGHVVAPLFQGATLKPTAGVTAPWLASAGEVALLTLEEQNQVGMHVSTEGAVVFFDATSGAPISRATLPLPSGSRITTVARDQPGKGLVALGLSSGQVLFFQHRYQATWAEGIRHIVPGLDYPYGAKPLPLGQAGEALEHLAINRGDASMIIAGASAGGLNVLRMNLVEGAPTTTERIALARVTEVVNAIYVDGGQRWLYVVDGRAHVDVFDLRDQTLNGRYKLLDDADARVTASAQLVGGASLLIGSSTGSVGQWFMTRDRDGEARLRHIRDFQLGQAPIRQIEPEQRRKGFLALDDSGLLGVFHATAHRTLLTEQVAGGPGVLALSPRANRVLLETPEGFSRFTLRNPHPEVSWAALWDKVWYEHYDQPEYVWQSTAANSDFEPKLSLAPLAFGTFKAALYAMLLAAPLAVAAAIYTAYFMAPVMRRKVKPVIELMEALPTVILGFIAGLVLAPFLESHLPGVFSLLLVLPLGILALGMIWGQLPDRVRLRVPEGWESALLIPMVVLLAVAALTASPWLEQALFAGDMRQWLTRELGLDFDQRNALVVGAAMGFAVIPTIYSIAEDAIFNVPRSLTFGSLALGATPWQTLVRVVLLTASPGIFSALMIGLGRAVGETMIVLMATGNTPIMDMNLFEGMRTLAANVAIELPESAAGSSHYRVLFLAALVLLLFTFAMNTLAELIRQRLRKHYSSL